MNQENDGPVTPSEEKIHELVADFHRLEDQGNATSPQDFIAKHPEHADALQSYFDGVAAVDQMSDPPPATEQTFVTGETQAVADDQTMIEDSASVAANEKIAADAPPTQFGRYKILSELGRGAMGAVYLAQDEQLDRKVALKIPQFGGALNKGLLERFYREARAAGNLRHPGICPVYDVGEIDGQHFITMAFIEGRPLRDFSKSSKRQADKQTARVIRKIAMAMAEAHDQNVIHRDLKPANIMIDTKNEPVVMDFGLARRAAENEEKLTHTGTVIGTPAYMSPEQVDGDNENVGPPADIYSLGVIFYELLTGELPFKGNLMSILKQISMKQPRPPVELHGDTDPFLQDLCLKMLAKEAKDRPESMHEVAKALSEWLQGLHAPTDESGILETSRVPGQSKKKKGDAVEATDPMTTPGIARDEPEPEEFPTFDDPPPPATAPEAAELSATTVTPGRSVSSSGSPPTKNRKLLTMAGFGGAALLLAGITFFINLGGKYDVKITVNDPAISLKVDGEDLIIDGAGSQIRLSAGPHTLKMERDGLAAELKEFTVTKDGENLVHVAVVNGTLRIISDKEAVEDGPQSLANASSQTPNEIAQWVINSGGSVITNFGDFAGDALDKFSGTIDALPEDPAEIQAVYLPVKSRQTAERIGDLAQLKGLKGLYLDFADDGHVESDLPGLARLRSLQTLMVKSINKTHPPAKRLDGQWLKHIGGLSNLEGLVLQFVAVTDSDLVHLEELDSLEFLSLHGSDIGDAGMGRIASLSKLHRLFVGDTHVGDDGVEQIAGMTNLIELGLFDLPITDSALPHLKSLNNLQHLYIQRIEMTAGGVSRLHQSLPNCVIKSDFEDQIDALKDSSGNHHHGKKVGAKRVKVDDAQHQPTTGDPVTNFALQFDKPSPGEPVPMVDVASLKDKTPSMTMEVWFSGAKGGGEFLHPLGTLLGFDTKNAVKGSKDRKSYWCLSSGNHLERVIVPTTAIEFRENKLLHIAAVRDAEKAEIRLYIDGKVVGRTKYSATPPAGHLSFGGGNQFHKDFFEGRMDEARISNVVRYDADFIPAKRFGRDEHTLALYHFDEGQGDVLKDSSGNGHHGKIVGAKWVQPSPVSTMPTNEPAVAGANNALLFSGKSRVSVLTLKIPAGVEELSIEGFVTHTKLDPPSRPLAFGFPYEFKIEGSSAGNFVLMGRQPGGTYTIGKNQKATLNRRAHVAAVKDGDQLRLYIDGEQVAESTQQGGFRKGEKSFDIGYGSESVIDEIRVSTTARYDANFTPAARHRADKNTLALYHFDEGQGDVLKDSSGNDHHGKIVGAKWVKSNEPSVQDGQSSSVSPLEILTSSDYEWTEPVNLGPKINTRLGEGSPSLSHDGCLLTYFSHERGGQIVQAIRSRPDEPFSQGALLQLPTGQEHRNQYSSLTSDGLTLVFTSDRPGGLGDLDLWQASRPAIDQPFTKPKALAELNSSEKDTKPYISSDGLTIYFEKDNTYWTARRTSLNAPFSAPSKFAIPRPSGERYSFVSGVTLSADGLVLIFSAAVHGSDDEYRGHFILMSRRKSVSESFGSPVYLTLFDDTVRRKLSNPTLSADGSVLVFLAQSSGQADLWEVRRVPRKRTKVTASPPPAVAPFDAATAKAHQEAWAKHLGVPVEKKVPLAGGQEIAFMLIPPGEFMMGSTREEQDRFKDGIGDSDWAEDWLRSESPRHRVRITRPFYLGKYEVTNAQWLSLGGEATAGSDEKNTHPLVGVKWHDIQQRISNAQALAPPETAFALPTEAQWEYACRAGATTAWHFGDDEERLKDYAWYEENSNLQLQPVGKLLPNAFGLHDMLGNAIEHCSGPMHTDFYARSPVDDPDDPNDNHTSVQRGGSQRMTPALTRSATRFSQSRSGIRGGSGFRLVLSIDAAKASFD